MKLLVYGNSGSGKSTYAKTMSARHGLAHLDLDSIVWEPGKIAVQRRSEDISASLHAFILSEDGWAIEGCYGELVEAASQLCTELVFLNPGCDACLSNNRSSGHRGRSAFQITVRGPMPLSSNVRPRSVCRHS